MERQPTEGEGHSVSDAVTTDGGRVTETEFQCPTHVGRVFRASFRLMTVGDRLAEVSEHCP